MTAKAESDAWLAEGSEEVERQVKKARAANGGDENLEADQGLAQHFKVRKLVSQSPRLNLLVDQESAHEGSTVPTYHSPQELQVPSPSGSLKKQIAISPYSCWRSSTCRLIYTLGTGVS